MPPVPFRIPSGIRMVKINAKTGQRAAPGDEQVIWEAFKSGTEPTDRVYILESGGINTMPSVTGSLSTPREAAATGTGGLY